jgi:hypothetical protein
MAPLLEHSIEARSVERAPDVLLQRFARVAPEDPTQEERSLDCRIPAIAGAGTMVSLDTFPVTVS